MDRRYMRNDEMLYLDKIKDTRISIRLGVLVSGLVAMYYAGSIAHAEYVHWHDTRYAKRTEIITLAQAKKIQDDLDSFKSLAQGNSAKLDAQGTKISQLSQDFSTYAASMLVSQARSELNALLRSERTASDRDKWQEEKQKLEAKVAKAEEYRQCVINQRSNCGRFLLIPN